MGQRWRVSFRTGSSQSMSNSFSDSVGPAVAPPAEAPSAARAAVPAAVFADDFGLLGGMVFTTSRRARQEARTEIGLRGSRRRARTSGGRAAGLATTPRATTGGKPRLQGGSKDQSLQRCKQQVPPTPARRKGKLQLGRNGRRENWSGLANAACRANIHPVHSKPSSNEDNSTAGGYAALSCRGSPAAVSGASHAANASPQSLSHAIAGHANRIDTHAHTATNTRTHTSLWPSHTTTSNCNATHNHNTTMAKRTNERTNPQSNEYNAVSQHQTPNPNAITGRSKPRSNASNANARNSKCSRSHSVAVAKPIHQKPSATTTTTTTTTQSFKASKLQKSPTNERTNERSNERSNERTNERTNDGDSSKFSKFDDGTTNERTNERTNDRTAERCH